MKRRSLILLGGAGFTSAMTGCVSNDFGGQFASGHGDDAGGENVFSVSISAEHADDGRTATHRLVTEPTDEQVSSEYRFDDLSADERLEFATAVARGEYHSFGSPSIADSSAYGKPVQYGDLLFEPWVDVGTDPRSEEDWTDPIDLDATLEGRALSLAVRNIGDTALSVRHSGRPYFGVLLAWDGEPLVFPHDQYDENDVIVTETDPIWTDGAAEREHRNLADLDPGESISEEYEVPTGLTDAHTVWLDVRYYGEEIGSRQALWTLWINEAN